MELKKLKQMEATGTEKAHPLHPLHHDSFIDAMLQIILQQISFSVS
jgi:hypothetical protein